MSLNSLQRRFRWLALPFDVGEILLTPERWAGGFDRATTRAAHLLAFDTTALARFLQRIDVVSPVRDRLLGRSAPLRWLDWKLRHGLWSILWCGSVVVEMRPRRTPIPQTESPINLLSAPTTYKDFTAHTLVVPDNVPRAEKSLGTRMSVQLVHLLQELYPIASTHQAEADADPQVRFDRGYTWLFRAARDTPRWHPDLVDASRQQNLLGALAAGGPFAKLLQRTDDKHYAIDLEYLSAYPVKDGLCPIGARIEYVTRERQLVVSAVRYQGERVAPGDPRWMLIERIALAALLTHLIVWRQGMEYHVGGLAPFPVLTHNYLPAAHPLRRLFAPHLMRWITTSLHTHVTLRRRGFDVTGFSFTPAGILRYYADGAAAFDIARLDVPCDARHRGMSDDIDYPYLRQALRYWSMFDEYVRRYIEAYYPTEDALQRDPHPRIWYEALDRHLVRGVRGYAPELTRDALARLCTVLMYSASVAHTENSLAKYLGFMQTTVHADGTRQTVGEVQDTIHFLLLTATPMTFLTADHSHVALDARGAEIMRGFCRSLGELQREMAAQPSRHWQLFPSEIEASVSC